MDNKEVEEKREHFEAVLRELLHGKYIGKDLYHYVLERHHIYLKDLSQGNKEFTATHILPIIKADEASNKKKMQIIKDRSDDNTEEKLPILKDAAEATTVHTEQTMTVQNQMKPKQKRPKQLTKEQTRDRNITWVLILGVILLLTSGLLLATSTWDILTNGMKTILILFVSILFYGLAFITARYLKINKTAFTFNILGSLFLPIAAVSIGFFELFGHYYSLFGDGRFIFASISSLFILPIYLYFSFQLQSRLYVWFSYITLTLCVGFTLASFDIQIDLFYLGIMLFNVLLIVAYRLLRHKATLHLFINEFTLYIQANLVLSSLLLVIFYNDEVMNGFNLIITAMIYLSMIYITKHQAYHYVFAIMLVYGAYQVIEFSQLQQIGPIGYAIIGILFLSLPRLVKEEGKLKKVFQYTSAVISGLAFVFITLQAVFLKMDYPSVIMLIAYLIITVNFIYLVNLTKIRYFSYLAVVFLLVSAHEIIALMENVMKYETVYFPMFIATFVIYSVVGCFNRLSFLQSIKQSSRDISIGAFGLFFLLTFMESTYFINGIMFVLLSVTSLLFHYYEDRKYLKVLQIPSLAFPISLGLAMYMLYMESMQYTIYKHTLQVPFGFVAAAVALLVMFIVWRRLHWKVFANRSFYVAQSMYAIAIILSLSSEFFDVARIFISIGGIAMAYALYHKTNVTKFSFAISSLTLLTFFNTLYYFHTIYDITDELFLAMQFSLGAVLLLLISICLYFFDKTMMRAFQWVAHIYLPLTLPFTVFTYPDEVFWLFSLTTIVYIFSFVKATNKRIKQLLLYASYTAALIMIHSFITLQAWHAYTHYAWFITSAIIALNWLLAQESIRQTILQYFVPMSLIGLSIFVSYNPIDLLLYSAIFIYGFGILYFIRKLNWEIINIIPLLLLLMSLFHYETGYVLTAYISIAVYGCILIGVGITLHRYLFASEINVNKSIDWYTIFGFVSIYSLYLFEQTTLWEKLLPGLLIALFIGLQKDRFENIQSKWIVFAAGTYLLIPYYTLLNHVTIPDLIIRELQLLPWIALSIVLQRVASKVQKQTVNYIQWVILVIVSLLLIQDGLASNTVYDALILGSLALISIISGFVFRMKSFFFVGSGVLLLNVFIQTRPFWSRLPWWIYLLIAGIILITAASLNELQKQRSAEGKQSKLKKRVDKLIANIKKWQ